MQLAHEIAQEIARVTSLKTVLAANNYIIAILQAYWCNYVFLGNQTLI
jgi:hypothetical protein